MSVITAIFNENLLRGTEELHWRIVSDVYRYLVLVKFHVKNGITLRSTNLINISCLFSIYTVFFFITTNFPVVTDELRREKTKTNQHKNTRNDWLTNGQVKDIIKDVICYLNNDFNSGKECILKSNKITTPNEITTTIEIMFKCTFVEHALYL